MPVPIPAGTKFEAIKPTTNVNRRSALVNANDLTYTIEDIAAAAGGTFPITNNYIPKANSAGSIVDSSLLEFQTGPGEFQLAGSYNGGINLTGKVSQNFANLLTVDNISRYFNIGDTNGNFGSTFGIALSGDPAFSFTSIYMSGISHLSFLPNVGTYDFGGITTRFGILDADGANSSLSVSTDLVVNVGGTNYIKVDVSGTIYNIELVP
jgi:hypothetical protein